MRGLRNRKYTGYDGDATGKLAGTEEFMRLLIKWAEGALWNNGTFGLRNMRGKEDPSVHCTARAGDPSYKYVKKGKGVKKDKGIPFGRPAALKVINKVVNNAAKFGLEMMIDYEFGEFGRAYRCDRDAWKIYTKMIEYGGGTGQWFHFELSPEFACSKAKVKAAFEKVFGPLPV